MKIEIPWTGEIIEADRGYRGTERFFADRLSCDLPTVGFHGYSDEEWARLSGEQDRKEGMFVVLSGPLATRKGERHKTLTGVQGRRATEQEREAVLARFAEHTRIRREQITQRYERDIASLDQSIETARIYISTLLGEGA